MKRALGLTLAALALALDQASKLYVTRGFESGSLEAGPFLPFVDLALQANRGISFSLFRQNGTMGVALLTAFALAPATSRRRGMRRPRAQRL